MSARTRFLLCALPLVLFALAANPAVSLSATITIINMDGAGEGFNDPTPAAPVGGNPGTTIGQQRLNVFNQAASIWGAILPSSVTILVQAQFDPLSCTATCAVLGSAGTISVVRDFSGAEFSGTWYHTALGNKLAGTDLIPGGNDINATFNSNLGQSGCLTGSFFYYGFDHNEGSNIDLLAVVLHELAHGLGFSGFANVSTGQLLGGFPGIYERFMLDETNGLHWNSMTDGQRQASAINTGNVVWDGTAVKVKSASFLAPRPEVVVSSPGAIAGTYTSGTPSFGAALTTGGVTGTVVLANDGSGTTSDACSALINGAAIAGHIALVDRGTCTFNTKAEACQAAGAIGMILVNNVSGLAPDIGGVDPTVTIPIASVSLTVGNAIKAQLGSGVTATLRIDNSKLTGADDVNRVLLFTPNPVQPGSSVSHWDVSAFPNLLMEPIINSDLTNVDLTRYAFEDEGWLPRTTSVGPTVPVESGVLAIGTSVPNPFTAETRVAFTLARPMSVRIDVIDTAGRLVRNLENLPLAAGDQSVTWDGRDVEGRRAAPGVYLVRVKAGGETLAARLAKLN